MLDVESWFYGKITSDAGVLSALGNPSVPQDVIQYLWPNDFEIVPQIAYSEQNQMMSYFNDNAPVAYESVIEIHVFTAFTASPTSICQAVDSLMAMLLFTGETNQAVPDPQNKYQHRVMRYRRSNMVSGDLY